MSDLRRAAEMALKALEELRFANAPFLDKAMEALRTALAESANSTTDFVEPKTRLQPEQECVYPECETGIGCDGPCGEKPVDAVSTSQERVDETAKREHDPVAWMFQHKETGNLTFFDNLTMVKLFGESNVRWGGAIPLYTAPPNREWVGLTKTEFEEAVSNHEDLMDICVAIEAKLKEKNT